MTNGLGKDYYLHGVPVLPVTLFFFLSGMVAVHKVP